MKSFIWLALLLPTLSLAQHEAASDKKKGFHNESEAGVVISSGNSRAQTYNLRQENKYDWDKNVLSSAAQFLRSSSAGIESAKNWRLGLRYERVITERLNFFLSQNIESDIYGGFKQRYNTDLGAKYFLRNSEKFVWFSEGGYRFTRENRNNGQQLNHSLARAYTEVTRNWNKTVSTKAWLEYLPNFSNNTDYRINAELSQSAAISTVFSIKSAYTLRFDNLPAPGASRKTDTLFTTSLVAKLSPDQE